MAYRDLKTPLTRPVITFERRLKEDNDSMQSPEDDEGFYPSLDKDAPGWIGDNPSEPFDVQMAKALKRVEDFKRGAWGYIGVVARAIIRVPVGGKSIAFYHLDSPGLWGVESDAGEEYLNEVYHEQVAELIGHLRAIALADIQYPEGMEEPAKPEPREMTDEEKSDQYWMTQGR